MPQPIYFDLHSHIWPNILFVFQWFSFQWSAQDSLLSCLRFFQACRFAQFFLVFFLDFFYRWIIFFCLNCLNHFLPSLWVQVEFLFLPFLTVQALQWRSHHISFHKGCAFRWIDLACPGRLYCPWIFCFSHQTTFCPGCNWAHILAFPLGRSVSSSCPWVWWARCD